MPRAEKVAGPQEADPATLAALRRLHGDEKAGRMFVALAAVGEDGAFPKGKLQTYSVGDEGAAKALYNASGYKGLFDKALTVRPLPPPPPPSPPNP